MTKIILTAILHLMSYVSIAQTTTESQLVEKSVKYYYDGYIQRDINKLYKAFDTENGAMKVPIKNDNEITGFKNVFFKDLVVKWGNREKLSKEILKNCALKILNLDIVDATIASAKINMKVDKVTYIDILSLQKIKGNWKITNKIYAVRN